FVLDHGKTHMLVTGLAEGDAGRVRYLRLSDELLGEFQRSELPVMLGNLGPDVHRGLGTLDFPSRLVQALDQDIAPLLVFHRDLRYSILQPFEIGDRAALDRGERTVVVIALDSTSRLD